MRHTAEETAMAYARAIGMTEGVVSALMIEPPVMEAA